ncbi:MAG: rRNA maturation RNase YbeY, partial [Rickettsiales bacterium]
MTADRPKVNLEVNIASPLWKEVGFRSKLYCKKLSELVLQELNHKKNTNISLLLCDDEMIQSLNKQFRQKDKPTNTLSFPGDDDTSLGDIAISYETTAQEATLQAKTFKNHFTHLYIHSLLHLLGYD